MVPMDAGGGNTLHTMADAVSLRYLGYPVVIDQTLPTSGTGGNL